MKPECRKYYRYDGSIEEKRWLLNGKLYRTDGPTIIYYRKNGSVEKEKWLLNDKFHRVDGPAIVHYKKNGDISYKYWFLNGNRIDPKEHLTSTPKTEEKKIELINKFAFIKKGNDYIFIKEWLRRDKEFYKKYRILIE